MRTTYSNRLVTSSLADLLHEYDYLQSQDNPGLRPRIVATARAICWTSGLARGASRAFLIPHGVLMITRGDAGRVSGTFSTDVENHRK